MGLVDSRYMGSFQTKDPTLVPWIGRQILIHWTTREVRKFLILHWTYYWSYCCIPCSVLFLPERSLDNFWISLQLSHTGTCPFTHSDLLLPFPAHIYYWLEALRQGGSKSNFSFFFFFLPACRFRIQGAVSHMYPSGTCAYIQRGNVFAENCILTAFSICQKKANLLRAQWIWRIWRKRRRRPLNSLLEFKLCFVT